MAGKGVDRRDVCTKSARASKGDDTQRTCPSLSFYLGNQEELAKPGVVESLLFGRTFGRGQGMGWDEKAPCLFLSWRDFFFWRSLSYENYDFGSGFLAVTYYLGTCLFR